jgi:hypothetical protein
MHMKAWERHRDIREEERKVRQAKEIKGKQRTAHKDGVQTSLPFLSSDGLGVSQRRSVCSSRTKLVRRMCTS